MAISLIKYIEKQLQYLEKAVDLAREQMENRLAGFPDQFVKKGETGELLARIQARLDILMEYKNKTEGMASQQSLIITLAIAITALIVGVFSLMLRFLKI